MGPLIPLFWTSGDVSPGFQSQGWIPRLRTLSPACNELMRFTSGANYVILRSQSKIISKARYHRKVSSPKVFSQTIIFSSQQDRGYIL